MFLRRDPSRILSRNFDNLMLLTDVIEVKNGKGVSLKLSDIGDRNLTGHDSHELLTVSRVWVRIMPHYCRLLVHI